MASDRIECVSLNIHTTTACTLKCKKCGWSFPRFQQPVLADIEKTTLAFDPLFKVYDHIHEMRFGGAEAFLYPHIIEMMNAIAAYQEQFDYAIIITNGTYIPKKDILEAMAKISYPLLVRVDNYGDLSSHYSELLDTLRSYGMRIDERIYTGKEQAFGGWVYYGDYTDKHYSKEQITEMFKHCRLPDDGAILTDDVLTNCCYATAGEMLGKVAMREREKISLLSGKSIEEMRSMVKHWRDEPFEACKYCNGFDPVNSPRISAAEQILSGKER